MARFLILICLMLLPLASWAQTDTSFWFAAPDIEQRHGDRPIELKLIGLDRNARVVISEPANPAFAPIAVNLNAGTVARVDLTSRISQIENSAPNAINRKGIYISASTPIQAYYEVLGNNLNTDIFTLKGQNALDTAFVVPGNNLFPASTTIGSAIFYNGVLITAAQNNTRVRITLRVATGGRPAGSVISVTLNRGESYFLRSDDGSVPKKLAGTIIQSDKMVSVTLYDDSVFPGGWRSAAGSCVDMCGDQIVGLSMLGLNYLAVKGPALNAPLNDVVFISGYWDSTLLKINGTFVKYLTRGETYAHMMAAAEQLSLVETNKKVAVIQMSGFGCEMGMSILPNLDCTGSQSAAFTRSDASSGTTFSVTLLVPAGQERNFRINGTPLSAARLSQFAIVPGTSNRWKYAKLDLSSQFPAISNVLITNDSMIFHCGMINGKATGSGCRFGYFSNFRKVSPRLFGPDRMDLCSGAELKLQFNVIGQPGTEWVLPNKTVRTGSFFYQPIMRLKDSGLYVARYSNTSCDINIRDSVRVRMDSAAISFSAKPARCLGDSLIIRPSVFSLSGAGPITWFYGTSSQTGALFRLKPTVPGLLPISAGFTTRNGCSMAWVDTARVVGYPAAGWDDVKGTICAGDSVHVKSVPGTWGSFSAGAGTQEWRLNGKYVSANTLLRFKNPLGTGVSVFLRIVNAEGCSDSVQQRRSIEDLKVNGIKAKDACAGEFVSLEAVPDWMNSTPGTMTWFPGDGAVLSGAAVQSHRYLNAGIFDVKFLMQSSSGCKDSSSAKLNIHESPKPSFSVKGGSCFGDTLLLNFNGTWGQSSGSGSLEWFANGVKINDKTQFFWKNAARDPLRLCVLAVNDQSCSDSAIQVRRVFDLPKLPVYVPAVCVGDETRMEVKPDWGNGQAGNIRWFAHDRDTGSGLLFVKRYPNAGLYPVKCIAVSTEGCVGSREVKAKVDPSPRASFRYSPGFSGIDTPFTFSNTSTGASSWIWNPESGIFLNSRDLVYAYPVGGYKKVLLIAVSDSGCRDTAEQLVFVREWIKYFIPNAFTPNRDDLNEVFRPVGLEGRVNRYEFRIFSRWGEKLYDGRDAAKGWDGRYGGKLCQEGQYVYELYYRDYLGQAGYRKGSFLLLR